MPTKKTAAAPDPLVTGLAASIARTIVPVVVGFILAWGARVGLDLDDLSAELERVVDGGVIAVYYAVVRVAETRISPAWGWLLGVAKVPSYPKGLSTPEK